MLTPKQWLSVGLFAVIGVLLSLPARAQRPSVVTCRIEQEVATGNNRSEVAYYQCLAVNGAIVPGVTFIVHVDAPGELWLRQLVGRTVDVSIEAVK